MVAAIRIAFTMVLDFFIAHATQDIPLMSIIAQPLTIA